MMIRSQKSNYAQLFLLHWRFCCCYLILSLDHGTFYHLLMVSCTPHPIPTLHHSIPPPSISPHPSPIPIPSQFTHPNSSLLLPDLTPNVGFWWYFFIEMFDSFRSFFLCVFQLHLLIYVAPLCIRLHRNPLAICTSLLGGISIFKSYPSVADLALYLGMLSLHVEIFGSKIILPPL